MSGLIVGSAAAGVVVIGAGWYIGTYNTFITAQQDVKTQWSNIKTEYQRRADLILNLVATVKSVKAHERDTLREVIQARGGVFAPTKAAEVKKMGEIEALMQRIMLVVEQYPKLVAGEQHTLLMEEIRVTEDRINVARTDYNATVRDYNLLVHSFPSMLVGRVHNFADETFFELLDEKVAQAPRVEL